MNVSGWKTIHNLTVDGNTQLRIDLEDWEGEKGYAMYDVFKVAGSGEQYKLTVDVYTGTAGKLMLITYKQITFRK